MRPDAGSLPPSNLDLFWHPTRKLATTAAGNTLGYHPEGAIAQRKQVVQLQRILSAQASRQSAYFVFPMIASRPTK